MGERPVDRRTERTLEALHGAFSELVQARRYDEIRVGDIVADAGIGRSTFYEHFRSKDDMLVESMGGMLDVLAGAVSAEPDVAALERVLLHLWENRGLARYLLVGPPARDVMPRLTRALADRIEERVDQRRARAGAEQVMPPRLVSVQLAAAQLGLLAAWTAGEASCSPAALAAGMCQSAGGAVAALLAGEAGSSVNMSP